MKKQPTVSYLQVAAIVFGGILTNIPLGVGYYYGNMSTYIDSYYIARVGQDKHTSGSLWIPTLWLSLFSVGFIISGVVSHIIGARLTLLAGMIFFNVSIYLSYFTLLSSFWSLHITLGILSGVGTGFGASMSLIYTTTWIKKNVGFCSAVVTSALGGGSLVFNLVLTCYINPHNLEPDINVGESRYFSSDTILDRVPFAFFVLGAMTTGCHLIAFPLMRNHPDLPQFRALKRFTRKSSLLDNTCVNKNDSNSNDNKGLYGTTESVDQLTMNAVPQDKWITNKEDTDQSSESATSKDQTTRVSLTPKQALRTKFFYLLGISQAFLKIGLIIENNSFKQFGIVYISDDYFLANVGVGFNIASYVSRIVWGITLDVFNIKSVLVCVSSVHTILSVFWYFTPIVDKWFYLIWTMMLQASLSGTLVIFPICSFKLFGSKHYITIHGMMQIFGLLVNFTVPVISQVILATLGWFWLFLFVSATSFIALILNTCNPEISQIS